MKYHVTMTNGDYIYESDEDVYELAYKCYEEAHLMNDYLVNIEPIEDV